MTINTGMKKIRNFCIIAHIDHGKSTLADRFLEVTNSVRSVDGGQMLDTMDLEQERGITIKLTPVRMERKGVEMNLIDTPGHVDFQYEVSRSLAAVEGCILLVDASQWIQAQTLSTLYMAMENELTIIPVLNKIDLPAADPERRAQELEKLLWIDRDEIIAISAKTWMNVEQVLDAAIERIDPPQDFRELQGPEKCDHARALIFDSVFDPYKGVVTYVKVVDGTIKPGQPLALVHSNSTIKPPEVGHFAPTYVKDAELEEGQIGYIVTGQKSVRDAQVGDTITATGWAHKVDFEALEERIIPGFKKVQPFVFAWVYPVESDLYDKLKTAFEKLSLNDSAITVEHEHSLAMGHGFRCGFLWTLHMDIIKERLSREYDMETLFTIPTVTYLVKLKYFKHPQVMSWINVKSLVAWGLYVDVLNHEWVEVKTAHEIAGDKIGKKSSQEVLMEHYEKDLKPWIIVKSGWDMPDLWMVEKILEPYVNVEIVWPEEFSGNIMSLAQEHRWTLKGMDYLDDKRVVWKYFMPMGEIIVEFYDTLKSTTKWYATMNYEMKWYEQGDLVRLDIFINGDRIEAFSMIVHNLKAYPTGKKIIEKLKLLIPKHMFTIPLQAGIGAKMIARETIRAVSKDVTAKCYGWDISRKKKLLKKQKEGKKKMKEMGRVSVPGDVFIKMVGN